MEISAFPFPADGAAQATTVELARSLAQRLAAGEKSRQILVLGVSARAWPLAVEVARLLPAPLDAALVKRLRLPGGTSIGAVVRGVRLVNHSFVERMRLAPELLEDLAVGAHAELEREETALREGSPPVPARGRVAVLVDHSQGDPSDWLAAARALRRQSVAGVILAVPAIDKDARGLVVDALDEVVTARAASEVPDSARGVRAFSPGASL